MAQTITVEETTEQPKGKITYPKWLKALWAVFIGWFALYSLTYWVPTISGWLKN